MGRGRNEVSWSKYDAFDMFVRVCVCVCVCYIHSKGTNICNGRIVLLFAGLTAHGGEHILACTRPRNPIPPSRGWMTLPLSTIITVSRKDNSRTAVL